MASSRAAAQAPESAPLILRLPASTRAIGIGNAWVAGRDEDVVFYNPAQLIVARNGFNFTAARYGSNGMLGSFASVHNAGPRSMSFGWGVRLVDFSVFDETTYPFASSDVAAGGQIDALSIEAVAGMAVLIKGFRIGAAAKYASDRVARAVRDGAGVAAEPRHDVFLADVGIARPWLDGTTALSVQNLGNGARDGEREIDAPLQASLGWASNNIARGPLDLGIYGQVTGRTGWIAPGGGVELGYGWIEGFSAAVRAGMRRTETDSEKPFALGASFTGDHLTLEYAAQFFDEGRTANRLTIRWR
jgi:hypothetical protein